MDGRGPGGVGFPEAVMEDRACGLGNAFISAAPARGSPFLSVRLACEGDVPLPGPAAGRWVWALALGNISRTAPLFQDSSEAAPLGSRDPS